MLKIGLLFIQPSSHTAAITRTRTMQTISRWTPKQVVPLSHFKILTHSRIPIRLILPLSLSQKSVSTFCSKQIYLSSSFLLHTFFFRLLWWSNFRFSRLKLFFAKKFNLSFQLFYYFRRRRLSPPWYRFLTNVTILLILKVEVRIIFKNNLQFSILCLFILFWVIFKQFYKIKIVHFDL